MTPDVDTTLALLTSSYSGWLLTVDYTYVWLTNHLNQHTHEVNIIFNKTELGGYIPLHNVLKQNTFSIHKLITEHGLIF